MSRQPSSQVATGAGFAAARGVALIGIAVVLGIVLLQVVDRNSSAPVAAAHQSSTTTTVTSEPTSGPTTTIALTQNIRPPAAVRIVVLNGGAPQGSAGAMADALRAKGYTNQTDPNDTSPRVGNAVMCRTGFDREGEALAIAVGGPAQQIAFSDPPPPSSDKSDCVVIVGGSASPTT